MRKSSFLLFTVLAVGSLVMGCQGACGGPKPCCEDKTYEDKADKHAKPEPPPPAGHPGEDKALPTPPPPPPHGAPEHGHPAPHH